MEFRLLGTVDAQHDGRPITLGRRRERSVLGLLLLEAGHAVPADRLINLLWDDHPRPSARPALQTSIARLRARLAPHGVALHTRGDTYLADVTRPTVDALRFEDAVAQARTLTNPAQRATLLDRALGWWRGPLLADAADDRLRERIGTSLHGLRLGATELRAEAHLACGRHDQVVTDLTDHVQQHPTREHAVGLLMLALHRRQQQTDALHLYGKTRHVLADELGLDPSAELRHLHEQILRDDPTLRTSSPNSGTAWRADHPTTPVAQVPRQLPAPPQQFTGRTSELAELDRPCDAATVVITAIDGMAGVGKTALAVHWAHRVRHHFPDGQLYIDLRGFTESAAPEAPSDLLERLLRALGTPGDRIPVGIDDRACLWRSILADRRILIVLDNAASAAQVRPLLPGGPGCLALVTSRRDLASLEPTHAVSLDILPSADAVTLFIRTAGPDRAAGAPGLVTEVVELCGRLPLAIRIAAARLRSHPSWSVAELAARLRDHDQRLAELTDEDGSRGVAAALDVSYQQLAADQQRLYRLLGLHPGMDVEPYAAAALASTALAPARRLLDQLLDANLLQEAVPGRYAFHDLVRSHAHRAAVRDEPEPARRAALQRLLDYYRQTVSATTGTAYPYVREQLRQVPTASGPVPDLPSPEAAGAWLDTELANLTAAVHHAADHGWPEHALQVAAVLYQHLHIRGTHHESQRLSHRTLAIARAAGDRRAEMRALACLAWAHLQQCEYPQAIDNYRQIRELAAAVGDQLGEMYAGIGIADILQRQGWYGAAYTTAQRPLELAEATGHELTAVWIRNLLGHLHIIHGSLPDAQDQHGRALEIAERLNDQVGGMYARLGLAHIEKRQGRLDAARTNYQRALAVARCSGNRSNLVDPLLGLADVARLQGGHRRAAGCYRRALSLAQATNNRVGQMEALHAMGHLCRTAGEPEAALDHHQQALALATDLPHLADQARIHDGLAHAHRALGRPEPARQHWRKALEILSELDTERTPEQEANGPAIRAHLAALEPVPGAVT